MNKPLEEVLKSCYIGCVGEEFEGEYVDVAVEFKRSAEIEKAFKDYIITNDSNESCWIWALFDSTQPSKLKYHFVSQDSGRRIDGRSKLAKVMKKMFDVDVTVARTETIKKLLYRED